MCSGRGTVTASDQFGYRIHLEAKVVEALQKSVWEKCGTAECAPLRAFHWETPRVRSGATLQP